MNAKLIASLTGYSLDVRSTWETLKVRAGGRCAACRPGRVLLHVLCVCSDHQFRWHLNGVARELAGQMSPAQSIKRVARAFEFGMLMAALNRLIKRKA